MTVDKYYIWARLFPTILTSIPAILFFNGFVAPIYYETLATVFQTLPTITNATFSAAIVFLLTQLNRFCAKEFFENVFFREERMMPTTNHLLWKDSFFAKEIKQKIRMKIIEKFDITLLSEKEEETDELNARKLTVSAVSQIRSSLQDNSMLARHNMEYGFFRNLIGGSLLAVIFSILILISALINSQQQLKLIALVLLIVYLIPVLLSHFFIKKFGNYYSKILYEQFLTLK
jgi:hypothetical protein